AGQALLPIALNRIVARHPLPYPLNTLIHPYRLAVAGNIQIFQLPTFQCLFAQVSDHPGRILLMNSIAERSRWLRVHPAFKNFLEKTLACGKIGRASCRESVKVTVREE